MEWYEIEVDGRITFPPKKRKNGGSSQGNGNGSSGSDDSTDGGGYGGIIKRGEWAWLAQGCTLHIVSLRNGQTMSSFEFADSNGYDGCSIRCVEELFPGAAVCNSSLLLAVTLVRSLRGSFVALYSVEQSAVLSCAELPQLVTCARFMSAANCRRSLLQNFDGCLALGTEEGVVILLDLNVRKVLAAHETLQQQLDVADAFVPCQVVDYNLPLTEIHRTFRQCQQDGVHFALQVEVIESPCSIQCILPIDLILGFAIGMEDGRLALYDLAELQIFYITMPQQEQEMSPLMKMEFLLPPDDPRPCMYVWALHEGEEELAAVLHSFMYEKRLTDDDDLCYFETFQTSSVRLQLSLEFGKCLAISCQSILTMCEHREDDSNCLCALTWYSEEEEKNKLLIYDLNQWYKEEMPLTVDEDSNPSYLAGYILNGQESGLHAYLNASTIAHFNSMQRFEEHFYPNSLSFDCTLLLPNGCRNYNWEGAQNKVINILRSSHATIFLEPDPCFSEILRTRLMPQFSEMNLNATFSRSAKYAIILSVALENNCFSLLRDCAKSWADGSFMGNFAASTGLSLSTLTEWIWQRATDIKSRCNDLCKGLFDFGGYPLDQREQKELGFITRQLKLLADLLGEVLAYSKRSLPEKVFSNLSSRHKSLRMAADYQDVLLWLLNIGLLPEASRPYNTTAANLRNATESHAAVDLLVPYPYTQLKEAYAKKRAFFAKIGDTFVSKQSGSCRLLYIDAFIEHECQGKVLRDYWLEHHDGDGLYPPASIESMLRVMLVPEVAYDSKCAILLYFFLDLHQAIDEHAYKSVVANFIKFPSVFKLSASLIKTVQAFWNLDHGHFLPAVDEFISPFNNNQNYPQWLLELLIETLLTQNAANLALRILEARPTLISPVLKLKTLLSNELISEAFHFARAARHDDSLLELFFSCCLAAGKFSVIRDLALSEHEGQLVQKILKRSQTQGAENLHFVYLLQKSKYIEAVSYMDELSANKSKGMRISNFGGGGATSSSSYSAAGANMDTPNLVLSAFNTTMTPVTQGLTDVYFRIKNKIKKKEADNKSPVPLSCQLIKQNANNLLGGIYHSSALSAHFATYYWGSGGMGGSEVVESQNHQRNQNDRSSNLLSCSNNAPFLRKPQIETHYMDFLDKNAISYPQTYQAAEKRSLASNETSIDEILMDRPSSAAAAQQNPKKRRRLLGRQEITNDLSHFMQMNKNSSRLNISEFSFAANPSSTAVHKPTRVDDIEHTVTFLPRPPLTKRRLSRENDSAIKPLASIEIHGILKTNTPEPAQNVFSRREPQEEEKSLRFRLPAEELVRASCPVDITIDNAATESFSNDRDDSDGDDEDEIEILVELQHEPSEEVALPTTKNITRSVSVESSRSSTSSKPTSDDDFYSPLASQNTSLIDNTRASGLLDSSALLRAANKYNLGGPQPRKPLARLSAERSEKSVTPEPRHSSPLGKFEIAKQQPAEIELPTIVTFTNTTVECPEKSDVSGAQNKTLDNVVKLSAEAGRADKTVPPIELSAKTSSHFGFKDSATSSTTSASIVEYPSTSTHKITAVTTSLTSKLTETFSPWVSSSKVCETQSKFMMEKTRSHVKFSEASTVVGSLTYMESSSMELSKTFAKPNAPSDCVKPIGTQMLDTTLGMSSYDLTVYEATSPPTATTQQIPLQTKPTIQSQTTVIASQTGTESSSSNSASKESIFIDETDIYEDLDEEEDEMEVDQSDLYDEALGLSGNLSCHEDKSNEALDINEQSEGSSSSNAEIGKIQESSGDENDDDNVIVLSSSDSSNSGDKNRESNASESIAVSDEQSDSIDDSDDNDSDEDAQDEEDGIDNEEATDEDDNEPMGDVDEESSDRREEFSEEFGNEVEIVDADIFTDSNVLQPIENEVFENNLAEDNKVMDDEVKQKGEEREQIVFIGVQGQDGANEEDNPVIAEEEIKDNRDIEDGVKQKEEHEEKKVHIKVQVGDDKNEVDNRVIVKDDIKEKQDKQNAETSIGSQPQEQVTIVKGNNQNLITDAQIQTVIVESSDVVMLTEVEDNEEVVQILGNQQEQDIIIEEGNTALILVVEDDIDVENIKKESAKISVLKEKTEELKATVSDFNKDLHELVAPVGMEISVNLPEQLMQAEDVICTSKVAQESKVSESLNVATEQSNNIIMNMEFVVEYESAENQTIAVTPVEVVKVAAAVEIDTVPSTGSISTANSAVAGSTENVIDTKDAQISDSQSIEEEISLHVDEDEFSENEAMKQESEMDSSAKKVDEVLNPEQQKDNVVEKQANEQETITTADNDSKEKPPTTEIPTLNITETEREDETDHTIRKTTNSDYSKTTRSSETDSELQPTNASVATPSRRNSRGISVPPQTQVESDDTQTLTPRVRRNIRASSLQPKSHLEYEDAAAGTPEAGTPRTTRRSVRGATMSPETATPTGGTAPSKITTRRRSVLQLDAINEGSPAALDSPSTRTRSRLRLNSMDSELDASIVSGDQPPHAKRTRRISISSSVSEQSQMPKRTRRNSITSQGGPGGTPRTIRARSVASNVADEAHDADSTKTSTPAKRTAAKRKKSTDEHLDNSTIAEEDDFDMDSTSVKSAQRDAAEPEDGGKKKKFSASVSPNAEQEASSASALYSSTRRLTRTQLAMHERSSAVIARAAAAAAAGTGLARTTTATISPPSAKRMPRRSTSRSTTATNNPDSDDDGASISSHQSNFSIPASKRRVTRSSVKDKDEMDDDLASIASSMGSETRSKRRSKEKSSPNTTLTAIPEDESQAHVEPKKRGRPAKK